MSELLAFPSIEQFKNVIRNVRYRAQFSGLDVNGDETYDSGRPLPTIDFIATTKLHGSNHSLIVGNQLVTQSRSRIITPEDDNNGAAKWSYSLDFSVWKAIKASILVSNHICDDPDLVIYGEWCGKGVNAGCAIHQLEKMFVIFAAKVVSEEDSGWLSLYNVDLTRFNQHRIFNVFQFGSWNFTINFGDPVDVAEKVNKIVELTLEIEKECPVGKFFGVKGIGEGTVLVSYNKEWNSSRYWSKSKGSEHAKSHVKKLATINVEKVKNTQDYVQKHTHEGRLQQGWNWLAENKKSQDKKSTPDFLRWVVNDVEKEERDEREASGLTGKDVNTNISRAARDWFFKKIDSQPL